MARTVRLTTILHRWLSFWAQCPKTWHSKATFSRNFSAKTHPMEITCLQRSQAYVISRWRNSSLTSTCLSNKRLINWQTSWCKSWSGILLTEQVPRHCLITPGCRCLMITSLEWLNSNSKSISLNDSNPMLTCKTNTTTWILEFWQTKNSRSTKLTTKMNSTRQHRTQVEVWNLMVTRIPRRSSISMQVLRAATCQTQT